MNKADKWLIGVLVVVSMLLYVPLFVSSYNAKDDKKEVVAIFKGEEVLRVDLAVDKTYEVSGSNGPVSIEVKEQQVRVEKEDSPLHICSIQGWVGDVNRPIICLPNDLIIQIESSDADVDGVTF